MLAARKEEKHCSISIIHLCPRSARLLLLPGSLAKERVTNRPLKCAVSIACMKNNELHGLIHLRVEDDIHMDQKVVRPARQGPR